MGILLLAALVFVAVICFGSMLDSDKKSDKIQAELDAEWKRVTDEVAANTQHREKKAAKDDEDQ